MIETQRLRLRPHRLDDFDDSAAMWADPRVVRYITGTPSTRDQSWSRLLRYVGHWTLLGYGYWVVEERATAAFVGEVGFADYHRQIEPSLDGIPELGWALVPHAQGKGYATEALRTAIDWGREHFSGIPYTACIIAPENKVSIRVAEKCDFKLLTHTTYLGLPALMYTRSLSS